MSTPDGIAANPPYACPKCGLKKLPPPSYRSGTVHYGRPVGGIGNDSQGGITGEHLLRTCECGYQTAERPKDWTGDPHA